MSTRRSSVGVAVLENRLYAVGGYDGASRQCLSSVERYDPAADRWESVAEMSARRSGAGVGVAAGALYALGGHDGPAVRRCAERYRPAAGWSAAPPMHSARRNAAVAAHRDRLFSTRPRTSGACCRPRCQWVARTRAWRSSTVPSDRRPPPPGGISTPSTRSPPRRAPSPAELIRWSRVCTRAWRVWVPGEARCTAGGGAVR
ncbi:unnamed protein product, partial [Leptidea sinapis]